MDLSTSIAQLSMSMQRTQLQQNIGTGLLKKTMDVNSELVQGTLEMLNAAPAAAFPGDIGAVFDVRA
ncbi:MAG: YjfB family protein [Oscillospiraceae bacterium]